MFGNSWLTVPAITNRLCFLLQSGHHQIEVHGSEIQYSSNFLVRQSIHMCLLVTCSVPFGLVLNLLFIGLAVLHERLPCWLLCR